jgi:hypothetical protein
MKTFNIGQSKSGIFITVYDDTRDKDLVLYLKWMEAAGLYHMIKEVINNPAYNYRDPKAVDSEIIYNQKSP